MYFGILLIGFAELFFTLTSVVVKMLSFEGNIPGLQLSFFRFFIGLLIVAPIFIKNFRNNPPNNHKWLIWRGIFNSLSVIVFFISISQTSLVNANLLNMTYPIFVFLITPFINKESQKLSGFIFLFVACIGIFLNSYHNKFIFQFGDLIALLSSIFAGLGVSTLKEARKTNGTITILFYMFLIGAVINGIALIPFYIIPSNKEWILIIVSALMGIGGQYLLTKGYKYIQAFEGSLVSTSRIVWAGIFGIFLFNEILTVNKTFGIILIVISIFGISLSQNKNTDSNL